MNPAERIGTLLFRYGRKELSRREKSTLDSWRKQSARNERLFQEETDPENMRLIYIRMLENKESLRKKMQEKYPFLRAEPAKPGRLISFSFSRVAAACLIMVATAGYFIFRGPVTHAKRYEAVLVSPEGVETALDDFHRGFLTGRAGIRITKNEKGELEFFPPRDSTAGPDNLNRMYTPADCRYVLNLLQGVRIWLNENSSVIYPVNLFQDTLRITIDGEVYLEVNRIPSRPLVISLPGTRVDMNRGQINFKTNADSTIIITTLIGGAALIFGSEKEIRLLPGQQVMIDGQKITLVNGVDTKKIISWMK
jgi:transmembrane sensor